MPFHFELETDIISRYVLNWNGISTVLVKTVLSEKCRPFNMASTPRNHYLKLYHTVFPFSTARWHVDDLTNYVIYEQILYCCFVSFRYMPFQKWKCYVIYTVWKQGLGYVTFFFSAWPICLACWQVQAGVHFWLQIVTLHAMHLRILCFVQPVAG